MNKLRQKAEKLRDRGYSYNMINQKLGIAQSTMSYWFKDRPFKPNKDVLTRIKYGPIKSGAIAHNKKVGEVKRLKEIGRKEIGRLSKRDLWLLGVGLYIGEGSKTTEMIKVSNSDPAVILTAVEWFRQICGLSNANLHVRLHIYPDTDQNKAIDFWQSITKIPLSNFVNCSVDKRKNKRNNKQGKLPYGTAHVYVVTNGNPDKGVKLYRKINGWIDGALSQI